ncbi:MAG: c-type cytochrome [Sphingobacteriaceae bacterium]
MLLVIVVTAIGAVGYVKFALPNVGEAPIIKMATSVERVKHGEYLANHVAACMDCHSERNWSLYTAPPLSGTLGSGGEYFGPEMGFPGKYYSRNLTPAGFKDWTDGEIFRAITTGVNKKGKALFPVMPYPYYRTMDKEDIMDIIAYLRQLPAIENKIPESSSDFPMNFILNTIPAKAAFTKRPPVSDTLKYGAYLVNMAACVECHTQVERGQIIPALAFAGGREFLMPAGKLNSSNITPDKETGIGSWTETQFVGRFKSFSDRANLPKVKSSEMNTIMPWSMYAGMDSTDLKAIYAYLRTISPVKNSVVKFTSIR